MKEMKGVVALVTGAAMGMGKHVSQLLLAQGCRLILVDINREALIQTTAELSGSGECFSYCCDISNREEIRRLVEGVLRDVGPVSILVNNAGIVKAGGLLDLEEEVIEKTIQVNLLSQFWMTRAFLPEMRKMKEGHIVNFASAGGLLALPNLSVYCASKFGVVGFSAAIRQEMKKNRINIGVTMVCPNTVDTGMFDGSKMVAGTKLLSSEKVAQQVIKGIQKNKPIVAVPSLPVKVVTPLVKALLPVNAMDWLNRVLGMWDANDTWKGRQYSS